ADLLGEVFGILRNAPVLDEEAIYLFLVRHGRGSDAIRMSYYRKKRCICQWVCEWSGNLLLCDQEGRPLPVS
ncbi:MAG: hypothetical protein ACUVSV_02350, partial [Armatimonadota bacterium]